MTRYYSDSDDAYYPSRQQSDNIRASGWQSPFPSTDDISSSGVTRLVVECPFDSKKCDYTVDKSQRGRLIVTARPRNTSGSNRPSSNNLNNIVVQTFTIPADADVDRLQSHVEQQTNRLIIEIPRSRSSHLETRNTYVRSPDLFRPSTGATHHNRKLEYRIDCRGYSPDELDVFIQDRDLIVRSRMKRSASSNPTYQHTSEQFSQKISLPNTVDLAKVVSYFENGELRVEAPLKRGIHYSDEEIVAPRQTSNAVISRIVGRGYNRIRSTPTQGNHRRHYRRHEHVSRYQPSSNVMQRVRSNEGSRYPLYRSPRDIDDEDYDENDNRYRRTASYHRYSSNRHHSEQPSAYRSVYEPSHNGHTTRTTTYRTYPLDNDMYNQY